MSRTHLFFDRIIAGGVEVFLVAVTAGVAIVSVAAPAFVVIVDTTGVLVNDCANESGDVNDCSCCFVYSD